MPEYSDSPWQGVPQPGVSKSPWEMTKPREETKSGSFPPLSPPAGSAAPASPFTGGQGPVSDSPFETPGIGYADLARRYQQYQTGGGQWQQYGVRSLQGMDLNGNNQENNPFSGENVSEDAPGFVHPLVQEAIKRGIVRPEDAEKATWEVRNTGDLLYEPGKLRSFEEPRGPSRSDGITGMDPRLAGVTADTWRPRATAPAGGSAAGGGGYSSTSSSQSGGQFPDLANRQNELYNLLKGRATQGLATDRSDPAVKGQADAYAAAQERARRNYISDVAESSGPSANLRGEQRMASERMGQQVGTFEAELINREMTAKRQEIADALQQMGGMLTEDQRMALQRELGYLDNAIQQGQLQLGNRELDVRNSLGQGDLDLRRLLGERGLDLESRGLNDANDRWINEFGLDVTDRANYWDSINRGLLK